MVEPASSYVAYEEYLATEQKGDTKHEWLDGVVYAISTRSGRLLHTIRVGSEPHGLAVWPQPGRYSIGHTGILR